MHSEDERVVSSESREVSSGILSMCINTSWLEQRNWAQAVLSDTRDSDKMKHRKLNKKLFYYESSQTLAEVAQRVGRVSFIGDIQNPEGHTVLRNLLQLALLSIQGLDKMISRGIFQPQSFRDFVVLYMTGYRFSN